MTMTKTAEQTRRYVIVDANRERFKRFLSDTVNLCRTQAEIGKVYDKAPDDLTWITYTQKFTDEPLKGCGKEACATTQRSPPPS